MPELPWIFTRLNARSLIDILAVALVIFWLLWVAQGTRATQLIRGLIILIGGVLLAASIFNLEALNWLLSKMWPFLIVAVPIIFQQELRRALEQLGHTGQWLRPPFSTHVETSMDHAVDEISRAAAHLSRIECGALIVIERETDLQEYSDRGVPVDATITRQLLINIFFPNSPLHDGAVIIRGDRLLAAACILPLSETEIAESSVGTRHRAAIGISEESDALAVVVSEETGSISLAHNGRLVPNLDQERLRRALRSLLKLDRDPRGGTGRSPSDRRSRERPPGQSAPAVTTDPNAAPAVGNRGASAAHD
jgi:diadenylate cyclase